MSTCILTGFDRSRKYPGPIYACDGSDLPATDDRGTTQVSGPYEAEPAVPATTVTYTIVGRTQCGDDIRRITTKTYSSRAFANGYRYADGNMIPNVGGFPSPIGSSGVVIGATISDIRTSITNACISQLADSYSISGGVYQLLNKRLEFAPASGYYIARYDYYFNGVLQAGTNGYFPGGVGVVTRPTLYYLDVHEVWTYDLV